MNVTITSRKFKAKDSLKGFIKSELNSLEKYYDEIMEANVVLSYTHSKDSIKNVEVILQVPGKTLSVSDESSDFQKSVTGASEKLRRQLKTLKSKKMAKVR